MPFINTAPGGTNIQEAFILIIDYADSNNLLRETK